MSATSVTYNELRERLQDRLGTLAPGQRRIADLLLTEPARVGVQSLSENAAAAGVHESSWVRFAKGLGLEGYPALVRLCREHISDQANLVRRFDRALSTSALGGIDAPDVEALQLAHLAQAVEHDRANIAETFSHIAPEAWDRAVTLLAEAPKVHVMGLRKVLPVAQLMTYLVHLVRRHVHLVAPLSGELIDAFKEFDAGDVFVAISVYRYTRDTMSATAEARRRGAHVIVITDTPTSPLTRHADVVFYVSGSSPYVLRSVTAMIALVQSLAGATAFRLGTSSRSQLLVNEELLDSYGVYVEE